MASRTALDCLGISGKQFMEIQIDFVLIEAKEFESTFFLCDLLACLKSENCSFLIVCMQQNQAHYSNILRRLGVPLSRPDIGAKFRFIDFMNRAKPVVPDVDILQASICDIQAELQEIGKSFLLCIDSLSTFLDLGFGQGEVFQYAMRCRQIAAEHGGKLIGATFVPKQEEACENEQLCQSLAHAADILCTIQSVPTGISRDLHCQLIVNRRQARGEVGVQNKGCSKFNVRLADRHVVYQPLGLLAGTL